MAQILAATGIGGGGILGAVSSHEQGQAASRMATMQAGQLEQGARVLDESASEQEAISQIKAKETKRQARLLQSQVIARAAAGGASTKEKNISDIITDIEGEGEYRALMDLYNGSSAGYELRYKAQGLRGQARVTQYEGKQARRAGNKAAVSGLLSSTGQAASFASKYNQPTNTSTL